MSLIHQGIDEYWKVRKKKRKKDRKFKLMLMLYKKHSFLIWIIHEKQNLFIIHKRSFEYSSEEVVLIFPEMLHLFKTFCAPGTVLFVSQVVLTAHGMWCHYFWGTLIIIGKETVWYLFIRDCWIFMWLKMASEGKGEVTQLQTLSKTVQVNFKFYIIKP